MKLINALHAFASDTSGATAVEYGLLLAVSAALILSWNQSVSAALLAMFNHLADIFAAA